jgi:Protein of unknown function (DUF4242)
MAEPSARFIAECFWVGVKPDDLSALDRRVERCVAGMTRDGESVRYLGSMLMPEDEVVLCFFEGSAATVHRAAQRAEVPFERILESDGTAWPGVKPPLTRRKSR